MSQYDNEKKIALFKNDKGDNPKRPDYRGTLTVNGVEYKASLWIRQDKKGNDYLNGTIEVKTEGAPQSARPSQFRPPESDSGPVKTFMKPQAGGASGVNAPADDRGESTTVWNRPPAAQASAPADDSLDAPF